ncbi:FAD-binding oxidoreductase [Bacillus nitroreducens]
MEDGSGESNPYGNSGYVIVYPKTEEEIVSLLKYANSNGKKISIISGGTKRGFGGLVEYFDILLSLKNYKGVVEHTVGDMTLTVRPGTTIKELQDYLAKTNQKISLDPAWPEYATIGGVIASNESGPKRLRYGSARDIVIGLRVVYPDGTVIRSGGKVVKNVAGYDMNKLFIGSMGTLGVLSEITFKLLPLPKYESLVLLSFSEGSENEIKSFAVKLLDSILEPVSVELLNPSLSKRLINQDSYTLALSFEDVESSVHYQEEFVKNNLQPTGTNLQILPQEEARLFWDKFSRIAPNGVTTEVNSNNQVEAALKVGVVNLDVLQVLEACKQLQDSINVKIEAHGGLGHGLCQINLSGESDNIVTAIQKLRESVTQLGGYAVVTHLPYALRLKVDVWGEKPSYFALLEGIKEKVDPKKVLNSKRFVGGI